MVLSIPHYQKLKLKNTEVEQNTSILSPTVFQTTIVGYGRYGNKYIGPKYAKSGYPWNAYSTAPKVLSVAFCTSVKPVTPVMFMPS